MDPINLLELPKERAQEMWEHVCKLDYVFDDFTMGKPEAFLASLFAPNSEIFDLEGKGLLAVHSIIPKLSAVIHLVVWDESLKPGRILQLFKGIARRLFEKYHLSRISAGIPLPNKQAQRLTMLAGFKYEGTIRRGYLYKGSYHDVLLYGLLRQEFEGKEGVQ